MPSAPYPPRSPVDESAADAPSTGRGHDAGAAPTAPAPLPRRTIALGTVGAVLLAIGAIGAGGVLVRDPLIAGSPFSWIRYGHGRDLATLVVYAGFFLMLWAWVRLGRGVLAERVGSRGVLIATGAWIAPLLLAPPLFTRDVYSYLSQGALALNGLNPYDYGPEALPDAVVAENVHYFWQNTPAPYGPLFMLLAKGTYWITGDGLILGVIAMRLLLLLGLVMLCRALPGLVRHLGGRLPVALWLAAASPMTVVHLVGGPHNDILLIGFMACGVLFTLERRHALGIVLVTIAAAIKISAAAALPFLVWIWASRLPGSPLVRFVKALAASLGIFLSLFTAITLVAGLDLGWVPALSAPSMIVNWLSAPTGVGQLVSGILNLFVDVDQMVPITIMRVLGGVVLAVIAVRQWWLAREGGTDAVRRAAIVLFFLAILSPAMLPWYLTWSLALAAAMPWRRPALVASVAATVWLVLVAYPSGEGAMYDPLYLLGVAAVSVLAAVSLVRPDPLRLGPRRNREHGAARSDAGTSASTEPVTEDAEPHPAAAGAEPKAATSS
ncbi:MAG TPA: polyprenol phosphomannose-dependent alpha 1,6 mannosyltransferase MptB [Pseudonocardiaceae bacterium]